jgi:hypothetical protein
MKIDTLEQAAINVCRATDGRGLAVMLCPRPTDIDAVRHSLYMFVQNFRPENHWLSNGEEAGCRNLALLANLLAEHLRVVKEKAA